MHKAYHLPFQGRQVRLRAGLNRYHIADTLLGYADLLAPLKGELSLKATEGLICKAAFFFMYNSY